MGWAITYNNLKLQYYEIRHVSWFRVSSAIVWFWTTLAMFEPLSDLWLNPGGTNYTMSKTLYGIWIWYIKIKYALFHCAFVCVIIIIGTMTWPWFLTQLYDQPRYKPWLSIEACCMQMSGRLHSDGWVQGWAVSSAFGLLLNNWYDMVIKIKSGWWRMEYICWCKWDWHSMWLWLICSDWD